MRQINPAGAYRTCRFTCILQCENPSEELPCGSAMGAFNGTAQRKSKGT